jgi:hypothetical protein
MRNQIHRGFCYTPRIAGNRGVLTTCSTLCPARRPWRGARSFPGDVGNGSRMEARQGAIRIFFRSPMVLRSAPQPAIRLHLMRDLVNRPISRPERERAGLLARRHFERSRIRCSWRLGPVRLRQASSRADDGMSVRGVSRKKFAMAPHCVRTIRPTRRSTPDVQPETEKRSTGYGIAAERGLNGVGVPSSGSPATKSTRTRNQFLRMRDSATASRAA